MNKTIISHFAEDVLEGLSAKKKHLSSKYFYDDAGSRIFVEIMHMPEYYPTACEFEILSQQSGEIFKKLHFDGKFNIVEFGSGDGSKTRHLLKAFLDKGGDFTYIPIDISQEANDILRDNMKQALPNLTIKPQTGDYFEVLDTLQGSSTPNLFLFLGGNIGNYKREEALELLKKFNAGMKKGDLLLIGMDLRKNPRVIQQAYDDPHGITKAFNMNLLQRINRELDADIQMDQFDFYCDYSPETGEVNSYLVSLKKQHFHSTVLNTTFHFEKDELIWTELSRKYSFTEIEELAAAAGFKASHNFLDCKHYFTDSLWVK
ncbi:L-histidine N(alpha)-methyltransferase [Flavobacterium sp. DG1-102-2]|uniref:L-histidine N(alpha)-methyltransferase n=1 Tax=Flavobacterium sp. DG1-102-2 TaxID=3081663 RepID=UPI00294A87A4|nr:L-histidine N(alpha)-methyltransferase [Flavobacterium sp. DG1-102-2]MDV6167811.1 L-histidine N(alpha)-methyltransferase [Flavobacterium sp. DG1-102-2]